MALELAERDAPCRQLPVVGVPAYFYPAPADRSWTRLVAESAGAIVIVNPWNGPGRTPDPAYETAVARVRAAQAKLFGYIDTDYGARDPDEVVAEAHRFRAWYGITNIFLDQAAADAPHYPYYRSLVERLRPLGGALALNPGQPEVDPRFLDLVEHVVLFEGPYGAYETLSLPSWVDRYRAAKMWHLVYGVPDATTMARVLDLAGQRNAGVVYVTDAAMPNPWLCLPPYWELQRRRTAGGARAHRAFLQEEPAPLVDER